MATLNTESPFQSWVLSQDEYIQGTILTLLQKQNIQNQICALSVRKNNLVPDFTEEGKFKFLQEEAELRGQIGALSFLIALSNETEASLKPQPQSSDPFAADNS